MKEDGQRDSEKRERKRERERQYKYGGYINIEYVTMSEKGRVSSYYIMFLYLLITNCSKYKSYIGDRLNIYIFLGKRKKEKTKTKTWTGMNIRRSHPSIHTAIVFHKRSSM